MFHSLDNSVRLDAASGCDDGLGLAVADAAGKLHRRKPCRRNWSEWKLFKLETGSFLASKYDAVSGSQSDRCEHGYYGLYSHSVLLMKVSQLNFKESMRRKTLE